MDGIACFTVILFFRALMRLALKVINYASATASTLDIAPKR